MFVRRFLSFHKRVAFMTYKDEQEAFIGNLHGTDISDFFLSLSLLPLAVLMLKLVQSISLTSSFAQDLLFLVFPLTVSLTLLSDITPLVVAVSVGVITGLFVLKMFVSNTAHTIEVVEALRPRCSCLGNTSTSLPVTEEDDRTCKSLHSPKAKLSFITLFRGGNLLMTCLSILAVDFPAYPRRFAKTELFGFSLMDTGAGTFIIASAITSKWARSGCVVSSSGDSGGVQYLVVLGLGVGRMLAIKTLGYQEHVSEYGTEWNFFVTLCFVWLIANTLHKYVFLVPSDSSASVNHRKWSFVRNYIYAFQIPLVSVVIVGTYQYMLSFGNLTDFVVHAPRSTSFFSSNREGFLSLCGYTPMYLLAEWFSGKYYFNQPPVVTPPDGSCPSDRGGDDVCGKCTGHNKHLLMSLLASGVCFLGWFLSASLLQPTSRRLTNMPFVFMVLGLAALMLSALLAVEVVTGPAFFLAGAGGKEDMPKMREGSCWSQFPVTTLEVMSRHQLVLFMIANVLTGAVNMTMQTLYIRDMAAFVIVFGYMSVVVAAGWVYDKREICSAIGGNLFADDVKLTVNVKCCVELRNS